MNNSFGLELIRLRSTFNRAWISTADHLLETGSLLLNLTEYVHIVPTPTPGALANKFIIASSSANSKTLATKDSSCDGLLLFASCSFLADCSIDKLGRLIDFIYAQEKTEHVRREANHLLFIAAFLKLKSEDDLLTVADIGHKALGCKSEIIEIALSLYLKFIAPWKPLSLLEAEECKNYVTKVRWLSVSHSRISPFFLITYLIWLCHTKRTNEYSVYRTSLLSCPNQFSIVAEAVLSLHELYTDSNQRTNRKTLEWLEWISPGSSLSSRAFRASLGSWIREVSPNELRIDISCSDRVDNSFLMQRYLAAIKSCRPNGLTSRNHAISFITSIYNGEEWIQSFLDNMVSLDGFDECELILINANSPQLEREALEIRKFQQIYPNIIHIALNRDPGLYNVWNLGALLASSSLISNANLDDRKAMDFISSHLNALTTANRHVSLVSAPCTICDIKNIGYEEFVAKLSADELHSFYTSTEYYKYSDFFLDFVNQDQSKKVIWRNIPHCMPVWRRELHVKYGFFNEARGGPTADLEFWLRCAKHGETFRNINTPKGLYYYNNRTTYSSRHKDMLQLISKLHVTSVETANMAYLEGSAAIYI